jgi:hypothetical protein
MPDEALSQRFEAVAQSAQDPLVRRYLEEAYRCFIAEAYNGAVVMAWNAVACYLRQVVQAISVALFEHNYRLLHNQNPPGELWRINDNLFIQTCQRMGALREVIDRLDEPRNRRNDCAHPTGVFVLADETLELVESIREVVSRQVDNERLADRAILREFVRVAKEQEGRAITRWVQDDFCAQLAHDLLTMHLRNETIKDASGIAGLWRGLWSRIDDDQKRHLWNHLERAVQSVLQDEQETHLRTPEDLVRLIVWPSPDEDHEARDRIGELYVEWFERLAESGDFRAVDLDLACELRQHLPAPLRERLQNTLQEMARRYTE